MSAMRQQLPEHAPAGTNEAIPFYKKIAARLQSLRRSNGRHQRIFEPLPQASQARLDASLNDAPIDTEKLVASQTPTPQDKQKTVLYLAYGSNLCNETFRGVRGIRPLSQTNVLVPSLRLTFDLPGVPYKEPCFANSALRSPPRESRLPPKTAGHKGPRPASCMKVTLADYAHIIATEGGGSAYKDILVDCYVLPHADTVPEVPSSKPFKAHTLFAPATAERTHRPDPSYAQPSGALSQAHHPTALPSAICPAEYRAYLHDIRAYTITGKTQAGRRPRCF
ncbi:hypothetical protein SNOG_03497 [Parastagonospora nodorum SN15]|uniref:gamma-glutamylcyclotransferase n=1 Tax=Phaeosphaeria nodorum (strain SN15 / ATCC MYA-4574 / FGSC 10173) TaxID=321614 RepID=Q0UXL7_PHANO|nr:hypothetical protein SNOG_03497 [Parastagonospora nodorum SN15]EAT88702.1 hypothetical protein SNOG_03497 [Parastagonospora nodorum SN15]